MVVKIVGFFIVLVIVTLLVYLKYYQEPELTPPSPIPEIRTPQNEIPKYQPHQISPHQIYLPRVPVQKEPPPFKRAPPPKKEEKMEVVHIDLKGSPPKKDYLVQFISKLSKLGVTGVMIEYEDTFPYQGFIENISARSAFTEDDIKEIVSVCKSKNIEVIPMIQTFGKMEHVLKLEEFSELRENQNDWSTICPKAPRSLTVIAEMIEQVMKYHPNSKRIHIGCGRVGSIRTCNRCKPESLNDDDAFFEHVRNVVALIEERYNKVKPLIWDYMARSKSLEYLMNTNLTNRVEIVFHDTTLRIGEIHDQSDDADEDDESIHYQIWEKYTKAFKKIWIAGAFRGADHNDLISLFPDVQNRVENQNKWNNFIRNQIDGDSDSLVGRILTGDSKSDHFARSVDLLPVSFPSLVLNVLKMKTNSIRPLYSLVDSTNYDEILNCSFNSTKDDILYDMNFYLEQCSFEELKLISLMLELDRLRPVISKLYAKMYENNNWFSLYHLENAFYNPLFLKQSFGSNYFYEPYNAFFQLYDQISEEMTKFFTSNVIEEWKLQHVEMYNEKMKTLESLYKKISDMKNSGRKG